MIKVGAIDLNRPGTTQPSHKAGDSVNRPYLTLTSIALAILCLTSCATTSSHHFAAATNDWRMRSGQLLYRNATSTLIGDVIVRFSKSGEFELTFSKGPGVTLLAIRQDAGYAEVKGPLARMGWSGPIDRAPQQLRGWLGLRDEFIHSPTTAGPSGGGQDRQSIRHAVGAETFILRF